MDRTKNTDFICETHGIHVGTGKDHIKHGIDDIEGVIKKAIEKGAPCVTFIIHSPRLTRFRYTQEIETNVKFVRGDAAYFNYSSKINELKEKYSHVIQIRHGVELDWMGPGLGLKWNRAKLFQARGVDFVIGSVHFSATYGLPYDGSKEETDKLIEIAGGPEAFWLTYLEELTDMVAISHDMIHVVGHLDLPKLYTDIPKSLIEPENSSDRLSTKLFILLGLIRDYNLVLDLNTSGLRKGCGIYPSVGILKKAREMGIPVSIGTDLHNIENLHHGYKEAVDTLKAGGYNHYISFSRGIREKRPLHKKDAELFNTLNTGIRILNMRFKADNRSKKPRISLGGRFKQLKTAFPRASFLGALDEITVRKDGKSITLGTLQQQDSEVWDHCLYSRHQDVPGVLSVLFNMLASEEINIENARLQPKNDGTAEAYLNLTGDEARIREAVRFVKGTAPDKFLDLTIKPGMEVPAFRPSPMFLLSIDGVELPLPVSRQMVMTIHSNTPGVLLILLSALASADVNVYDLQIGERGDRHYAVLGVEGDMSAIKSITSNLGPYFYEVSCMDLDR